MGYDCISILSDEFIHQGDIIKFRDNTLGIVITGDCDTKNKKNNNIISFCKIITIEEYFAQYYFIQFISRKEEYIKQKLVKEINEHLQSKQISGSFTPTTLELWIKRKSIADLFSDIEIEDTHSTIELLLSLLFALYNQQLENDFKYLSKQLVRFRSYQNSNKTITEHKDEFRSDLKNHILKMPGDWFMINTIQNIEKEGYMVYLRNIYSTEQTSISVSPLDNLHLEFTSTRIARLNSPFRYRLTQKLGSVFMDIGLPNEFSTYSDLLIDSIKFGE